MRKFRSKVLLSSVALFAAVGCSGSGDEASDNPRGRAAALCDAYTELEQACGYSKFETRADCEATYAGVDAVRFEQTSDFYSCLGACGDSQDPDFGRLTLDCGASAFGHSGPWGELCARTCSALSAASCAALPAESACLDACARTVIGDCSDEMTALDGCNPSVSCGVDGTPMSPNCAEELSSGLACLAALGAG